MISLVVTLTIGVVQVYLAWQQLRHSRNQATPHHTGPAETTSPPPSPPSATSAEPTPSSGSALPPHDAPAEPPPPQRRTPEPPPHPEPPATEAQAGESRPSPPPDAPVEDDARGIIPVLLAYIAPASLWVAGLVSLAALGWIFGYDDLAEDYKTPTERVQLSSSLWFMAAALLISSTSTGFTAYAWSREKSITDDNEERFNLYVATAVLGPPLAVWLVIARRAVMF
ncbi:hypothetical protein ACIBQX_42255 [Nonomuraea sp. NPDC049714]|uniref:hypothetical protein n=1 Tax=Nonomuraea sp. NPDC049714 TaxID=3364357 RepID=UPI0037A3167A